MSTGISISSINRIKELAERKKFKEALEILDTQNLEKSINPQFMKISGEIFRENKRYYDSRKILLKAHQMAPQGNRILYELIQLYLELGYYTKAQKYYEQYMFYATPEDTQRDYVEYIMKKATGADVKDLAAILIPILERMPEDKWNFEAILLYHKMDRKDMALEESRYILENFKESEYVQPVIDYIDDKLDVDEWFNIYPKEEKSEDVELFGDLMEQEREILEADYRRMFPPEAKIMVEAEDHDAYETAPAKEKKEKKTKKKPNRKHKKDLTEDSLQTEEENVATEEVSDEVEKTETEDKVSESKVAVEDVKSESMESVKETIEQGEEETEIETPISHDEQVQKEREDALEKILSKKVDRDKIKESAKQMAKAVKEIDTDKARKQVKSVAESVKDNVKKATSALGEAVGTKAVAEPLQDDVAQPFVAEEDCILDGIIEGVLEPPKKAVGQVVMNEELDALIPDSLEAMSEQEIHDIEWKKEEQERLELEALETTLKLEEEKKAKRQSKSKKEEVVEQEDTTSSDLEAVEEKDRKSDAGNVTEEETQENETDAEGTERIVAESSKENPVQGEHISSEEDEQEEAFDSTIRSTYAELKSRFMDDLVEDEPLESLGFISVVHSDVDATLEEDMPDAAGMLRQMIDNKEFYTGEDSFGFEAKASYENHGFEVEDYDFDTYRNMQEQLAEEMKVDESDTELNETETETLSVQDIFAQEGVVDFEDVIPEETEVALTVDEIVSKEMISDLTQEEERTLSEDVLEEAKEESFAYSEEQISSEDFVAGVDLQESVWRESTDAERFMEEDRGEELREESVTVIEESLVLEDAGMEPMQDSIWEMQESMVEDSKQEEPFFEPSFITMPVENAEDKRNQLRTNIVLSYRMESMLVELKESR